MIMLLILTVLDLNTFQKKLKKIIKKSTVVRNIFRIHSYDSIMCGYFCIDFIDFMFKGKSLTDFANLFLPNNFKTNDDIVLNYFMTNF